MQARKLPARDFSLKMLCFSYDISGRKGTQEKLDMNYSLNPGSIIGYNGDKSEFFIRSSRKNSKTHEQITLPKSI